MILASRSFRISVVFDFENFIFRPISFWNIWPSIEPGRSPRRSAVEAVYTRVGVSIFGSWMRIVPSYLKDKENLMEKYNAIRPKAETTFSSLKSRKKIMQMKETYICVIACYMVRSVINTLRVI